ncbi:MAG: PQQ-dependent sugar dehydrogenase, partial [Bacteroidota bacterium]|nr:PQQ-dependent sugar dehydrogenase [Bacteroidota bacterium]
MTIRLSALLVASICLLSTAQAQYPIDNAFPGIGFSRPLDIQHAGDGSGRLFVVEQAGRILVFPNDAAVDETTEFLDIRDRVSDSGNEEGLLGLAFHPDYKSNGYFYINYSASGPRRNVIARYRVSDADANRADRDSESVLLTFEQPYSNHNGGQLAFGPDGF